MDDRALVKQSIITPELYFLISKFLAASPLQETAKVLIKELETCKILPKRLDWTGQEHNQNFKELEKKFPHIGPNHLLEICCRISPILDKELIPSIPGVLSLLGAGRQSILRTKDSISKTKSLLDHCTRFHHMPISDSINRKNTNNLVKVLYGRESAGPIIRKLVIPTSFYGKQELLRRTLGHLSAVYCVLFDRTGKYIITGADDLLVKLWSAVDGRLLTTFRGASAEITDIAVNLDNTLLAAGSLDRILRVWDLQTAGPIAVLTGHTGMITSVNFCPSPRGDLKYLVTTSTDGSVAFWQYTSSRVPKTVFASKPIQYHEKIRPGQAQMICASFSPGGIFLAAGSADHHVRVYIMSEDGPKRILEVEAHTDTVDSIQWAHNGLRFISGGKDGIAHVWHFESQQWKSMKINMSDRLTTCPEPEDDAKRLKVTMVSWDYSDNWVMTAVNDYTIKVWNTTTGKLHKVLRGHTDELYVLESHPKDPHVLLSAGHDGQLFLWDIYQGVSLASFINHIDGQIHGGVFDAKWSPDGTMIAATDSHGHILMFGFGTGHERFKILPRELFFHTDYRPLIRDANYFVMDEQTQTIPHLMPPPFLVDVDGNPHPPALQRLVPGRENCPSEQLIPNIAVGAEGVVEVVEEGLLSNIDRLIEALANRNQAVPDSNNDRENGINRPNSSPRSGSINGSFGPFGNGNVAAASNFGAPAAGANVASGRVDLRRSGDIEGIRHVRGGDWQPYGIYKWIRRIYVKPIKHSVLQTIKQTVYTAGMQEFELYRREMRRRPLMINTSNAIASSGPTSRSRGPKRRGRAAYRTRAVREREPVIEVIEPEIASSSSSSSESSESTAVEDELVLSGTESSDTESSDYSDWVADQPGITLEPPKRSRRRPVQRRTYSPGSDSNHQNDKKPARRKKIPIPTDNGEIPESYRTPEWLSEVIPRKAPYYPQMGDEIVYLRQAHQRYLDTVRSKKVYKISNNCEPWQQISLREHEFVKVIGIKYEIRPPRLCCLKLALLSRDGHLSGQSFTIKYHDMPDVLDFLVLRQTFDTAVRRNWSPGDRFRCMIDDGWWMGQIESRHALTPEFPNSMFMCFRVRWDNGEYEYMSPWDMEPIDEHRLPAEIGGAVPVLPDELRALLYQPKTEEWPRGDRDASCRRIITGLEQVMGLAIADPFLAPVDLNIYPSYAFVVEYPIDISTIKARVENHFYRRIPAAQFDVRYLATNAEKFNQPHSPIVKHARIITDLCLRIIRDPNAVDVGAVYHQLVDTYVSSDSDAENATGKSPSPSSSRPTGSRRSRRLGSERDWLADCRELLEMIWQCDDSTPFREPVDTLEHPDYSQIIDTPMDLRTIKEDLLGGNYITPFEFAKDMRLIFQNSRNYNTNKRSRIYSMTLRLSTLFEAHIKPIIYNWKSLRRRPKPSDKDNNPDNNSDRNKPGTSKMVTRATTNGNSNSSSNNNLPGPSGKHQSSSSRARIVSDDSDEDDDDDMTHVRTRNGRISRPNTTSNNYSNVNNGLAAASSSSTHLNNINSTHHNDNNTNRVRKPRNIVNNNVNSTKATKSRHNNNDTGGDSSSDSSSSSSNDSSHHHNNNSNNLRSNSDDDSDDNINLLSLNNGQNSNSNNRRPTRCINYDSEDSYKPNRVNNVNNNKKIKSRRRRGKRKNNKKNNKTLSPPNTTSNNSNLVNINNNSTTRPRNRIIHSEDEDDDDETSNINSYMINSKKRQRQETAGAPATNNHNDDEDDEDEDDENPNNRKHRRYESDHSYHLELPNNRRLIETESETEVQRPTRGSLRRARMEWGRAEDSLESEHDDDNSRNSAKNKQTRRRGKVKRRSETDNSNDGEEENSQSSTRRGNRIIASLASGSSTSSRTLRSNKNRPSQDEESSQQQPDEDEEDNDDDESNDDRPLSFSKNRKRASRFNNQVVVNGNSNNNNSNSSNSRQATATITTTTLRSNATTSIPSQTTAAATTTSITGNTTSNLRTYVNRRQQSSVTSTITQNTRSHSIITSTNSNINTNEATATSTTRLQGPPPHQVDHNYGEPGPSTLMRQTRRNQVVMLSRHQRNADELDQSMNNTSDGEDEEQDPLEDLPLVTGDSVAQTTTTALATSSTTTAANVTAPSRLRLRNIMAPTNVNSNSEGPTMIKRSYTLRTNNERNEISLGDIIEESDADADATAHSEVEEEAEQNIQHLQVDGDNDDDDDDDDYDDPEDNQPLRLVASTAKKLKNAELTQLHNTRFRGVPRRNYFEENIKKEKIEVNKRVNLQPGPSSGVRNTRNLKRPRYNYDSDESAERSNILSQDDHEHHEDQHLDGESSNSAERKKLRGRNSSATNSNSNSNSSNSRSLNLSSPNRSSLRNNRSGSNVVVDIEVVQTTTRTTPSSTVGGMTLDDILSDNEQHVSISSRGRVRKITAKARGLFRE